MPVRVIKHKVFDGNKTYEVGEVIEGLSDKDESQLVSDEIAEYIGEKEDFILPGKSINETNTDNSAEIIDDAKKDSSEEDNIPPDSEDNISDLIDPSTFALNSDDYLKPSESKGKKGKAN